MGATRPEYIPYRDRPGFPPLDDFLQRKAKQEVFSPLFNYERAELLEKKQDKTPAEEKELADISAIRRLESERRVKEGPLLAQQKTLKENLSKLDPETHADEIKKINDRLVRINTALTAIARDKSYQPLENKKNELLSLVGKFAEKYPVPTEYSEQKKDNAYEDSEEILDRVLQKRKVDTDSPVVRTLTGRELDEYNFIYQLQVMDFCLMHPEFKELAEKAQSNKMLTPSEQNALEKYQQDILIHTERAKRAFDFTCRGNDRTGFPPDPAEQYFNAVLLVCAIDLNFPVSIITFDRGSHFQQRQQESEGPGAWIGSFFLGADIDPDEIAPATASGISILSLKTVLNALTRGGSSTKVTFTYELQEPIDVLVSTARPTADTWSLLNKVIKTAGGAEQLFLPVHRDEKTLLFNKILKSDLYEALIAACENALRVSSAESDENSKVFSEDEIREIKAFITRLHQKIAHIQETSFKNSLETTNTRLKAKLSEYSATPTAELKQQIDSLEKDIRTLTVDYIKFTDNQLNQIEIELVDIYKRSPLTDADELQKDFFETQKGQLEQRKQELDDKLREGLLNVLKQKEAAAKTVLAEPLKETPAAARDPTPESPTVTSPDVMDVAKARIKELEEEVAKSAEEKLAREKAKEAKTTVSAKPNYIQVLKNIVDYEGSIKFLEEKLSLLERMGDAIVTKDTKEKLANYKANLEYQLQLKDYLILVDPVTAVQQLKNRNDQIIANLSKADNSQREKLLKELDDNLKQMQVICNQQREIYTKAVYGSTPSYSVSLLSLDKNEEIDLSSSTFRNARTNNTPVLIRRYDTTAEYQVNIGRGAVGGAGSRLNKSTYFEKDAEYSVYGRNSKGEWELKPIDAEYAATIFPNAADPLDALKTFLINDTKTIFLNQKEKPNKQDNIWRQQAGMLSGYNVSPVLAQIMEEGHNTRPQKKVIDGAERVLRQARKEASDAVKPYVASASRAVQYVPAHPIPQAEPEKVESKPPTLTRMGTFFAKHNPLTPRKVQEPEKQPEMKRSPSSRSGS